MRIATSLAALSALLASGAACGGELVGAADSSSTGSSSTEPDGSATLTSTSTPPPTTTVTTATTADTGNDCPIGGAGCACTEGGACDEGLECIEDVCADPSCPVGAAGCMCTAGGACDGALECVADSCVDPGGTEGCPVGAAGCPCTRGGACDPGLMCEAESCVDTDPETTSTDPSSSSSSSGGGNLDCGNGLIDDGEQCDDGDDVQGNGCNNDCQESAAEVWTIGYAGPDGLGDDARSVAVFPNGDFVVTGYRGVAGDGFDILTRKYDPSGALIWERSHSGAADVHDFGFGVAIDPDDAVIVAGIENPVAGQTAWIRKYDVDGAEIWTRTFPEGPGSAAYGVAVDQAGDIVVVGSSSEIGQSYNTWIRKYTSDGDVAWEVLEDQGNGQADLSYAVHADAADNVIAVGALVVDGGASSVGWARGYDADGGLLWSQELSGTTNLWGVSSFATDEVYLSGLSDGGHARLVKVDEEGQVLWGQNYAPPMQYAEGHGVATDSTGAIVVSGVQYDGADYELLARKWGANGSGLWTRTHAGDVDPFAAEIAYDVAITPDDDVIVVGFERVDGQNDWWIRRYTP